MRTGCGVSISISLSFCVFFFCLFDWLFFWLFVVGWLVCFCWCVLFCFPNFRAIPERNFTLLINNCWRHKSLFGVQDAFSNKDIICFRKKLYLFTLQVEKLTSVSAGKPHQYENTEKVNQSLSKEWWPIDHWLKKMFPGFWAERSWFYCSI